MTKTELTIASGNQLKNATEADSNIKKFSAHVMEDGKAFSPSRECKRLLEFHGTTGKKSYKKARKRENERGIKRMHYWVRDPDEKLLGVKCKAVKLHKGTKMNDLYHIHCSHQLGVKTVAL